MVHRAQSLLLTTSGKSEEPWIGTFHKFGAFILRSHGHRIGLDKEKWAIADDSDVATLLKRIEVSELWSPALLSSKFSALKNRSLTASAVSAAVTEHCKGQGSLNSFGPPGCEVYRSLVALLQDQCQDQSALRQFVAVYAEYEKMMRASDLLDFDDLLLLSKQLLTEAEDVRLHYSKVGPSFAS